MEGRIRGIITEFKRFATHDGPGIRTTVFFKGCPLRCIWCSNPETWVAHPQLYFKINKCTACKLCVKVCPLNVITINENVKKIDRSRCDLCMRCVEVCEYDALEIVGKYVTVEEVVNVVERDLIFYQRSGGGVTLSGGEPLQQPEFATQVLKVCKQRGIHTVLDTCGYAKPEVLQQVLEYTDLVLLDIKHMDPEKHKAYTGVSNDLILDNAKLMADCCDLRFSLPLVPNINDSENNIRKTCEFAKSIGVKYIDIEPLHKFGEHKYHFLGLETPYSTLQSPTAEEIRAVKRLIEQYGLKTTIGRMM